MNAAAGEAGVCFLPALEIARRIRERSLSAVDVTAAFLTRIAALNDSLNAFVTVAAEPARAAALAADRAVAAHEPLGVFHGVPVAVKDLLYTAGIRTSGGSCAYKDFVPDTDALPVARLKAAGAILIGKTNTSEFGYRSTTENRLIGPTRNPWNHAKTAGGSSGGAAAASAAGLAPLSVGTDAGGSIRTPASFCGVFGFKPTFGRVPTGPALGGGRSISHVGPITRTVADAAAIFDVMAGPCESDRLSVPARHPGSVSALLDDVPRELRIGWSADLGFAPVDPLVAELTATAVAALSAIGWHVEAADPGFADPIEAFNVIIRAENHVATADLLDTDAAALEPGMREFILSGATLSAQDYLLASARRDDICLHLERYFAHHDLLVTPTLAVPPLDLGNRPTQIAGRPIHAMSWLGFTYPFNLSGNPAATVPCGFTADGLPVGLQIVGPRYADALVLRACAAFEQAQPWADRRPLT